MDAEEYRQKARHFLAMARHLSNPEDRAQMIAIADYWRARAERADQEPVFQQQQQEKPSSEDK